MVRRQRSATEAAQRAVALLNRGAALLAQGRAEEAIRTLEQAHRLDAQSVPIQINLGGAYVLAGHHGKAIPVLESARDAEPDNPQVWLNLGAAYLGNPLLATRLQQTQAIVAFGRAVEIDPAIPSGFYNLGLVYLSCQEHDLAAAAFEHALQVNPFDRDAKAWLTETEARRARNG